MLHSWNIEKIENGKENIYKNIKVKICQFNQQKNDKPNKKSDRIVPEK